MRLTQRKVGLCNNDQWMAKPVIPQSIGKSSLSSQRALPLSLSWDLVTDFPIFLLPAHFGFLKRRVIESRSCLVIESHVTFQFWANSWPIHMSLRLTQTEWWRLLETAGDCWSVPSERRAVLNSRFLRVIVGSMAAHDIPTPIWIWFPVGSFHPFQGHRVPPFTESMNLNGHRASHLLSPWQSWSMG